MSSQQDASLEDPYIYPAITEPDTIRLIRLEPSPNIESELRCSLIHENIHHFQDDTDKQYTALSYVWGDASDRRQISIDGKSLSITASLHCALRHIRDPDHSSTVWADGVCINQASSLDRNSQVSMMGSIYQTAHRTLVFLGTSTSASDEIMAEIRIKTPGIAPSEFYEKVEAHILSRPWFSRVWTLQELVLSKNPLLQMGTARIDWETFSRLTTINYLRRIFDLGMIRSSFKIYKNASRGITTSTAFLHNMLSLRRGSGVSDPRDMIFGHLGLCPLAHKAAIQSKIPVDYGKSVTKLYEDVARQIILDENGLSLLADVEWVPLEERRTGIPSWVPDWTVYYKDSSSYGAKTGDSRPVFTEEQMFEHAHVLTVRGTHHGTIELLLPDPSNSTARDDLSDLYWEMTELDILSWVAKPESQHTANAIFTSFCATCEKLQISIWEDQRHIQYPSIPPITPESRQYDTQLLSLQIPYQARVLVSRLYARSQGIPEETKALLPTDLATLLLNMFMNLRGTCHTKYDSSSITAVLSTGRVTVVPQLARRGDILCVMDGHERECIVRPCESQNPTLVKQKEDGVAENVLWVALAPMSEFQGEAGWELVFGREDEFRDRETVFHIH
ncbi:hypothetical protein IFR05_012336 [Cadophora sp. M221]|nr:hypothetical protein IFR05_012336 [Cadophora sp. M221]